MNKATESQKKILMLLLMVIVFFAAYRFGYEKLQKQTDEIAEQNVSLEEEIEDLKRKVAMVDFYDKETETNNAKTAEILTKFGPGVTPEKSILFFIDLAEAAGVQIPTISFGEVRQIYTTSSLTGVDGVLSQYVATYSVAYSTTYEGLKMLIAYINQYPEKMQLNSLTAAYNSETSSLSGNFSIDWYMVTGTNKQYEFKDIETIDIGNGNIFRSGSGSESNVGSFEFDFGFETTDGTENESGAESTGTENESGAESTGTEKVEDGMENEE